jgi:hypothetical protein
MALVRVSSGRPAPEVAELVVVGSDGGVLERFDPLPDPPGTIAGGAWRGGFAVPTSFLGGGGGSLRLVIDGA